MEKITVATLLFYFLTDFMFLMENPSEESEKLMNIKA